MHKGRALLTGTRTQPGVLFGPLGVSPISLEKRLIVLGLKENARLPTIDLLEKELKSWQPCDLSSLMGSRKIVIT